MTLNEVSEEREWTVKEWKTEIDRQVKEIGVESGEQEWRENKR